MKHKDLKVGLNVEFTFAGSQHQGEILKFKKDESYGKDTSRYLIQDKENFKYPIAVENIIKVVK